MRKHWQMETPHPTWFLSRLTPEALLGGAVALVATMGAFARYLQEYLKTGEFSWRKLLASYVVSMFTAAMFALFIYSIWPNVTPAFVVMAGGTGAYFGDKGMIVIFEYMKSRLKLQESVAAAKPRKKSTPTTPEP